MGREKLKEETEEDLEDTIGGEKTTSQTARLAGRREGGRKKLQVGGSWWAEKARRGRGNTVPEKSARRK